MTLQDFSCGQLYIRPFRYFRHHLNPRAQDQSQLSVRRLNQYCSIQQSQQFFVRYILLSLYVFISIFIPKSSCQLWRGGYPIAHEFRTASSMFYRFLYFYIFKISSLVSPKFIPLSFLVSEYGWLFPYMALPNFHPGVKQQSNFFLNMKHW